MIYQANHRLRLDRARHHLDSLETEVARWIEEHPYRISTEFDLQSAKKLIKIYDVRQPPAAFSLITGDCLHNLRACLDNLVYELAERHQRGTMTHAMIRRVEFPIFLRHADWLNRSAGPNRIQYIPEGAKTVIENLQPYKRGDRLASMDALWILNELSNIDKHRLPHLTFLVPESVSLWFSVPVGTPDIEINWGPVEEGAVIARYAASSGSYAEMSMQRPPTLGIAFKPTPGLQIADIPVPILLKRIYNYIVQRVIPPLLPHLA